MFTEGFTQYVSPTQVYLLALVFRFVPPSILVARTFSAFWVFAACLLLGLLAKRISGQLRIGLIVGVTALLTPWFFEVRGLVIEPHFVPFALVLLLLAIHYAQTTVSWNWRGVAVVAASLALLTYCYSSGRVLGPLFALGLLLFATTGRRFLAIAKIGILYGITLIPILVFNWHHPGALTSRFFAATYMRPGVPWRDAASEFVRRYLEDQSLIGLLQTGHPLPRHHVIQAGGVFFFATFILAMAGLLLVVLYHRRDPWWRFVLYGTCSFHCARSHHVRTLPRNAAPCIASISLSAHGADTGMAFRSRWAEAAGPLVKTGTARSPNIISLDLSGWVF